MPRERTRTACDGLRAAIAWHGALEQLRAVLGGYGRICQHGRQHGADALVTARHHGDGMASHQRRLQELFAIVLSEAVTGEVR